ncbi:ImmA/IrrE family metallo-endopeptidase [Amycolatopsis lurida]
MTKWSIAHRRAHMVAEHALADAGLAGHTRVDILSLLAAAGLHWHAGPGQRLFGSYLPGDSTRPGGIWINANMPAVVQRHTAGHELGHHALEHGLTCDTDADVLAAQSGPMNLTEATAEAFAAWVLMPRRALARARAVLGNPGEVPTPTQVYLIALQLGTSYRGTARHLGVARLIPAAAATALGKTVLGRIKDRFEDPTAPPRTTHAEVWPLHKLTAASELTFNHGDRIVLPAAADTAAETLIVAGVADILHHSDTAITLTARALPEDALGTPGDGRLPRWHDLPLPAAEHTLRVRVEPPLLRPPPVKLLDVSAMSSEELDRELARRAAASVRAESDTVVRELP